MTLNERKTLNAKIKNGEQMTFQDAMNMFFLPEDQDAFARSQGWEDMQQMAYYENLASQEQARMSEQDGLLHELAKVDSREVYHEADFSEWAAAVYTDDMAGVY